MVGVVFFMLCSAKGVATHMLRLLLSYENIVRESMLEKTEKNRKDVTEFSKQYLSLLIYTAF
jgi:hypothetical protein